MTPNTPHESGPHAQGPHSQNPGQPPPPGGGPAQPPQQGGGYQQGGYPPQGGPQQYGGYQRPPHGSGRPPLSPVMQGITSATYKSTALLVGVGLGAAVVISLLAGLLLWATYDRDGLGYQVSFGALMDENFFSFMHLPAAGFRNAIHYNGSSLTYFVLLISFLTVLTMWLVGRKVRPASAPSHWAGRLTLSAAAGLVFWGVLVILSAIFAWAPGDGGMWAGSFGGAIFTMLAVGAVVWAWLTPAGQPVLPLNLGVAVKTLWEHVLVLGFFGLVLALISVLVDGGSAIGAALVELVLGIPTLVFTWFNGSYLGSTMAGDYTSFTMAGLEWWELVVMLITGILALAVFAIRWAARGQAVAPLTAAWRLPAVYGAGGLVMMFAAYAGENGLLSAGPAGWNFLLLTAVGAVLEVLARFVLPLVLHVLPGGLLSWINVGISQGPQNFQQLAQHTHQQRSQRQFAHQQAQQQQAQQYGGQQFGGQQFGGQQGQPAMPPPPAPEPSAAQQGAPEPPAPQPPQQPRHSDQTQSGPVQDTSPKNTSPQGGPNQGGPNQTGQQQPGQDGQGTRQQAPQQNPWLQPGQQGGQGNQGENNPDEGKPE